MEEMNTNDSNQESIQRELEGLVPLCNFKMTGNELEVTDDFKIRSLEKDETDIIAERVNPIVACKCSFGISTEWKHRFESPNILDINLEKVFRSTQIVTALRLYDAGDVAFPIILHTIKGDSPNPLGFHGWGSASGEAVPLFGKPFMLTDSRSNKFREFWGSVNSLFSTNFRKGQETGLNIALRRFNYSYWNKPLEDKIVDIWIGFEALVGDQSRTTRLIGRLQVLLGRNDDEQNQLKRFLRNAYNTRSDVVHGRVIKDTEIVRNTTMTFKTVVFELQRLLAKAIKVRTFISSDNWRNRRDFIELLDASQTSSGKAEKLSSLLKAIEPVVFTDQHSFFIHEKTGNERGL